MRSKSLCSLGLLLLLSLLLLGCGAGGADMGGPAGGTALHPAEWSALNHGSQIPTGSGDLPAFPTEDGSRGVSLNDSHTVLGSDFLLSRRVAVEGTAARINVGPADGERVLGWAEYQIGGLAGLHAISLNVQCLPQGLDQSYFVALADFSSMSWKWFGPANIPEFQIDLSQDNRRYISNLGNLYFVVLCHGDNVGLHSQSTVVVGDGNGNNLPGAPMGLHASKGEFPDGVALVWQPGPGAGFYEVQRRDVYAFPDGNGQGGLGEWITIGAAQTTQYFDANLPPGVPFDYRVRSVNQFGHSAWSNIDRGFAFGPPPPGGEYPLQGYVWGLGDNNNPDGQLGMFPLPGAVLTVSSANANFSVTVQSDENGFYFVPQLEPGDYVVSCQLAPWAFEPAQAFFSLTPGMPGAWIDFVGRDGGGGGGDRLGVHGYVYGVDQNGDPNIGETPLEGAKLIVWEFDTANVVLETYSDADGFYQILQLPPGTYTIGCEKAGWIFFEQFFTFQVGDQVPDLQFDFWGQPNQN